MVVFYSAISLACEQVLSRAGGMRGRGWWREGKETQNTRRTIECVQALFPLPLSTPPPRPPPRERACSGYFFTGKDETFNITVIFLVIVGPVLQLTLWQV